MTESEYREEILTRQQAINQVHKHGINPIEFLAELGSNTHYTGEEVLNWLGY